MIFRPQRTRANRYPDVVLRCDGVACSERETFPYGQSYAEISLWCARHHWTITRRNERFEHRCSSCVRLTKAPQAYWDRLTA